MLAALFVLMTNLTAEPADVDLTAMSFNIRYGTANDGDNSWPKRSDTVVNAITSHDPDIVGLQECLRFQAEYIVDHAPDYRWFGIGREKDGEGEYCAVLYKYKRMVPVESGHFWLSETPDVPGSRSWDSAITRMATWVRYYLPKEDRFFYHVNTHFDHRGDVARAASAVVITERMKTFNEDYPVIITGDFNATAEKSDPYNRMIEAGLQDAWTAAKETRGPRTTFGGFEPIEEDRGRRIDWIFTRGDVDVSYCETSTYNEDGRYPSDHLPVVAGLTLRYPAESE